ncbi:hypothetical protein OPW36_11185 [Vibrio europaeus]|uniref:hypothetical protein n=1 Tax=Vibrio europaeus TaxID=300876 RepID=UPI00233EABC8|nr:hypothetical protein [Vibrio europaeus]MDC5808024.1 hypothetical protein [Vibrio europaeus]MDC5825275.1 hypothetical protein [Vibrio europaeus]MDC5830850.1 hypothetical protein [Vibrio europaeus]MDC5833805.1 hypothetical protein [Vibrio europaeus]
MTEIKQEDKSLISSGNNLSVISENVETLRKRHYFLQENISETNYEKALKTLFSMDEIKTDTEQLIFQNREQKYKALDELNSKTMSHCQTIIELKAQLKSEAKLLKESNYTIMSTLVVFVSCITMFFLLQDFFEPITDWIRHSIALAFTAITGIKFKYDLSFKNKTQAIISLINSQISLQRKLLISTKVEASFYHDDLKHYESLETVLSGTVNFKKLRDSIIPLLGSDE